MKLSPKNSNKGFTYNIAILFDSKKKDLIFSDKIEYLGGVNNKDLLKVYNDRIEITAKRSSKINLKDIFYNHNSSLYSQIIKSILFYYAICQSHSTILSLKIVQSDKFGQSAQFELREKGISQPIKAAIKSKIQFDPNALSIVLNESDKSKVFLTALSYWLIAVSSSDRIFKFERLWRALNQIYIYHGKTTNDLDARATLRAFLLKNDSLIPLTVLKAKPYQAKTLRDSFRWRGLILNDYSTSKLTKGFKDFVCRYEDERIMKLFDETLVYREKFLKDQKLYDDVRKHIDKKLKKPVEKDVEIVALICLKYAYFVRNKFFHGEVLDATLRLVENKEEKEIDKINELLELLVGELLNINQKL